MPNNDDTCVLCGGKAPMSDLPHLAAHEYKCSETGGCTTFRIGYDPEEDIEKNTAGLKEQLLLLSRAAQRYTREGNGPMLIAHRGDIMRISGEQEGWEQLRK